MTIHAGLYKRTDILRRKADMGKTASPVSYSPIVSSGSGSADAGPMDTDQDNVRFIFMAPFRRAQDTD